METRFCVGNKEVIAFGSTVDLKILSFHLNIPTVVVKTGQDKKFSIQAPTILEYAKDYCSFDFTLSVFGFGFGASYQWGY